VAAVMRSDTISFILADEGYGDPDDTYSSLNLNYLEFFFEALVEHFLSTKKHIWSISGS
jgi:hypothetical protein